MARKPDPVIDAPRVRVLTDICTLGRPGEVVAVPDGVHVQSLIEAGHVEPVTDKEASNGS